MAPTTASFGADTGPHPAMTQRRVESVGIESPISHRMPGQDSVDLSVFKAFDIYERLKVQFRAEAINALNTPMFGRPDTNFNTPNFGKVTTQRNFPRLIQFGVRLFF